MACRRAGGSGRSTRTPRGCGPPRYRSPPSRPWQTSCRARSEARGPPGSLEGLSAVRPTWGNVHRSSRSAGVISVAGGLVIIVLAFGPTFGANARSAPPVVRATPKSGLANAKLEVSGSGCPNAVVTYRVDQGTQSPIYGVGPSGTWAITLSFPNAVGPHRLDFECSSLTTVGAPTTPLLPGVLRFKYQPLNIVTRPTAPTGPPPTCQAVPTSPTGLCPSVAEPASPATGPSTFTG